MTVAVYRETFVLVPSGLCLASDITAEVSVPARGWKSANGRRQRWQRVAATRPLLLMDCLSSTPPDYPRILSRSLSSPGPVSSERERERVDGERNRETTRVEWSDISWKSDARERGEIFRRSICSRFSPFRTTNSDGRMVSRISIRAFLREDSRDREMVMEIWKRVRDRNRRLASEIEAEFRGATVRYKKDSQLQS